MDEKKQPARNNEGRNPRTLYWGTIALAAITLLISAYFFTALLGESRTFVLYLGMASFLTGVGVMVVSVILTIRGRQERAIKITLTMLTLLVITAIGLFEGRAATASLTLILISVLTLRALFPSHSRRNYAIMVAIGLVLVWAIELIGPPWRIDVQAASAGPIGAVIFALILAGVAFFQARERIAGRLRNKLVAAFTALSILSVGAVTLITNRVVSAELTQQVGDELKTSTQTQAQLVGNLMNQQLQVLNSFALSKVVQDNVEIINRSYKGSPASIEAQINTLDQQWRASDAADNDNDPLVAAVLNSDVASELREFKDTFPSHIEVFVTDKYGANFASTNRTSDYYQADEGWWQAAYNNGQGALYIGQPEFDESAQSQAVIIAVPLYGHGTREVVGILRSTYRLDEIVGILSQFGSRGGADLLLPDGQILREEGDIVPLDQAALTTLKQNTDENFDQFVYDGTLSLVSQSPVLSTDADAGEAINNLGWVMVLDEDPAVVLAPVNTTTRAALLTSLVALAFAVIFALILGYQFTNPLNRLIETAKRFGDGDLTARAFVTSKDEVGSLAGVFNKMSDQLKNTLEGLEQRVADRTRNLELAAEVGRAVSQVRVLDVMLKDACELILKEFNLYYVQVYLTDPSQTTLKLEAGTGNVGLQLVGRGHSLPLNTGSINGRAAVEKRPVVISNTGKSATFRQNPLLPDTHGEMAVPLIVADKVVGVLDMQSNSPGVLTEEVLPAFEALAGQLAVAIQNANLLAETEQARAQVEAQARRLVHEGWREHLDAIHKPEQLGFVFDHNKVTLLGEFDESHLPENGKAISAPISITGESLGSLVVELDDETRREQTSELVSVVARQVAQQIENLRLLESAERYRYESEKTARLQTVEGWQKYLNSRTTDKLGFMYDLKEVRPYGNGHNDLGSMFAMPLKTRDEMIGRLSVQGLTDEDHESIELVNAIGGRLSAHIENLRLFEETRVGQMELDKRARQLAAVAEISTASSQELDVDKLLRTVVHLTQRQFSLYHVHAFTLDESTQELHIAACGWEEGDENEGTHESVSIPVDQEQSLVARAARTGQSVIVNDVKSESGWLANPLLPDTVSEMAVPLMVGNQVLGVLDVQSDRLNAFTEEDANIQTTLASQVATAMQNARSFKQAQKQAEREAMLNVINQKIQSATSVEAVLQIAARELGHALGAPMTVAQLSMKNQS